jgi:AraC-like DNA-binding protein
LEDAERVLGMKEERTIAKEQKDTRKSQDSQDVIYSQGNERPVEKEHTEKSTYQENRFNERLPHSLIQFLVYNLASEDGKNLAELDKMSKETPHEAQFKEIGSIKEDMIKLLGVIEYFSVELGVPERQASVITDYYIGKVKHSSTQETLEKLFARAYEDYRKLCLESKYKRPKDKIKICIEYIETHTESNYDMKLLSELVGYNPSYLSQKFKKVTGMTITEYGLRCRLKEADVLLRHTDVPISEIAGILCFSSQSHFQKAFKKQYKMTPRNWRLYK